MRYNQHREKKVFGEVMRIKVLFLLAILVTALFATGCADKDPLLGKWIEPSSGITIEFKDDGTVITARGNVNFTMNYEKQDPDILIFKGSTDGTVPEQRMTYKIEENQLLLTIDGVGTVFNRK
jgi:outer membrane lipoprotein-sorting protein